MTAVYVISDNQFFALGLSGLLTRNTARVVSPQDVSEGRVTITKEICYLYVQNRERHREVCQYLKHTAARMIFFLPGNNYQPAPSLPLCFWPARISLYDFRVRLANVSQFLKPRLLRNIVPRRYERVLKAAEGLEQYMDWAKRRSVTPKTIHNHHRVLITSVGIDSVSVHTLFLSEYIAAGHVAAIRLR